MINTFRIGNQDVEITITGVAEFTVSIQYRTALGWTSVVLTNLNETTVQNIIDAFSRLK